MWQQTIDDFLKLEAPNDTPVPRFNPYEILEPEKINMEEKILVDLRTDEEKKVKEVDANLQMGSFLDTVTKSEYNVLDLYQNIYVTPQHIKGSSPKYVDHDSLIDFGDFFDKLEAKDKNKCNANQKSNFSDIIHNEKANVHDYDKLFDKIYRPPTIETDKCDNLQKVLNENHEITNECMKIENVCSQEDSSEGIETNYDWHNNLSSPIKLKHELKLDDELKKDEEKNAKACAESQVFVSCCKCKEQINLEKSIDFQEHSGKPEKSCEYNDVANKISYYIHDKIIKEPSLFTLNNEFVPVCNSKDLKNPPILNMITNNQFNWQTKPDQLLQTAVKDAKLYAKQHNPDEKYTRLTKGPDLYEKSIVLPQIMERLAARKRNLDAQKIMQRRLILDSGTLYAKSENSPKDDKAINQKQLLLNQGVSNFPTNEGRHKDEMAIYQKQLLLTHGVSSISKNEGSYTDCESKPQVVMDDCRKYRLIDLKIRKSFEKFVKTGKLD